MISFHAKSSNNIIFQIYLDVLSNNNLKLFVKQNKENEKEEDKQYFIYYSKKLKEFSDYTKKRIKLDNSSPRYNSGNKKIGSFIIYSDNKNKNNLYRNYSCANLVKLKQTKINRNKILIRETFNEKYSPNKENAIKNCKKIISESLTHTMKYNKSTKNSTNNKQEFNNTNANSYITINNSKNISAFNGNISKIKNEKINNVKKYIKFINDCSIKENITSSLIVNKTNSKKNEYNDNIRNKILANDFVHKKIFFNNINNNINILKNIYERDSRKEKEKLVKIKDRKYSPKYRFKSCIKNRQINIYVNNLLKKHINISGK